MPKNNIDKFLKAIIFVKKNLEKDLPFLIKGKKKIKKGLYFGKNVKVEQNVLFDTTQGTILIDDRTKIKANAILRGPLFIGKDCVVNSFTEISNSKIGDVCKIGGEIEGSIMAGYSNKQHHGCLLHSYVGKWVNIGAGTNVSDLKNTYSSIKMGEMDTGQQFLGCVIGDYSKTAINASIFCGKVIGVSSHLYGTVTEDVPSFVSHLGPGVMYELPLVIAEKIQKAMMKRRGLSFTDKDHKLFKKLFADTTPERKKAKVKKGKLKF